MNNDILENLGGDMGSVKTELSADEIEVIKVAAGKLHNKSKKDLKSAIGKAKYAAKCAAKGLNDPLAVAYGLTAAKLVESLKLLVEKSALAVGDFQNVDLNSEVVGLVDLCVVDQTAFVKASDLYKADNAPGGDTSSDPVVVKVKNVRNILVKSLGVSLNGNQVAESGQIWPETYFVSTNVEELIDTGHVCVTRKKCTHGG